jgi:predicted nucleic acid-binding protein
LIVADASVLVDFATQATTVPAFAKEVENNQFICAPTLADYEFHNVLRKLTLKKRLSIAAANEAISIFKAMQVQFFDSQLLTARMWELRTNMTAYDAAYIALAEILDAPLFTTDSKFANSPLHRVSVVNCRIAP